MPQDEILSWCFVGILSALSLAVWVTGWLRFRSGRPLITAVDAETPAVPAFPVIVAGALVLSKLVSLADTPVAENKELPDLTALSVTTGLNLLIITLLLLPIVNAWNRRDLSLNGFGAVGWQRRVGHGFVFFLASVLPVVLFMVCSWPLRTEQSEHALLQLFGSDVSLPVRGLILVLTLVIAPVLEELMYRVILQSWLSRLVGTRDSLIITAVVFAAVHRLPDAIPLLPLAFVLGYTWQQKRCFLTNVTIHCCFNAANLMLLLLSSMSD